MAFDDSRVAASAVDSVAPVRTNAGLFGAIGIVAGLSAIAASSCCVVPLIFAALGAGTVVFGTLEALVSWRLPLLVASSAWMAVAWFAWSRNRPISCDGGSACAERPRNWVSPSLLLLATLIVVVAIGWNYLEFPLLRLMRST